MVPFFTMLHLTALLQSRQLAGPGNPRFELTVGKGEGRESLLRSRLIRELFLSKLSIGNGAETC